jgi:protein SCO1/2
VILSIDPNEKPKDAMREKKERLTNFGRPGPVSFWHFLTGDNSSIEPLAASIGFHYAYDPALKEFAHPNGVVVLTPTGRISRYFYGLDFPVRDLTFGLMDASSNKIGSPIDQISLTCYHYDPVTGKYSLEIMAVIRMLAILTVVLMAGGISLSLLHERRQTRGPVRVPPLAGV